MKKKFKAKSFSYLLYMCVYVFKKIFFCPSLHTHLRTVSYIAID